MKSSTALVVDCREVLRCCAVNEFFHTVTRGSSGGVIPGLRPVILFMTVWPAVDEGRFGALRHGDFGQLKELFN